MCGFHVLILKISPYMAQVSPELFNLNLPNVRLQASTNNPAYFQYFVAITNYLYAEAGENTQPSHVTHSQ